MSGNSFNEKFDKLIVKYQPAVEAQELTPEQ